MRLRQIEVFYAIMTTGSLRAAAELLHVSQPAASKVLRYAEQSLGFALFERTGGRLVPTREARILLPHVNEIFDRLGDLRRLSHNLRFARDGHSITLGCVPSLGLSLVPRVVQQYQRAHPTTELTIDAMHGSEIAAKVLHHDLDLGIVFGDYLRDGLAAHHIGDIPLVLVDCHRSGGRVAIGDLDPTRYIGLSDNDPTANLLAMALEEAGLPATPRIRARTHYMAVELARLGTGYAIVDALTALHHHPGPPHPVALEPQLHMACSVIFRADYALNHISSDILALLRAELEADLAALHIPDRA